MDVITARKNPQKFIDYLSADERVNWHFVNDPIWSTMPTPSPKTWGWCGTVQMNFNASLTVSFPSLEWQYVRRWTFHQSDATHTATWYGGIIIDTMFNALIYNRKYYKLTSCPIVELNKNIFNKYYRNPCQIYDFSRLEIISGSKQRGSFPSLLP